MSSPNEMERCANALELNEAYSALLWLAQGLRRPQKGFLAQNLIIRPLRFKLRSSSQLVFYTSVLVHQKRRLLAQTLRVEIFWC